MKSNMEMQKMDRDIDYQNCDELWDTTATESSRQMGFFHVVKKSQHLHTPKNGWMDIQIINVIILYLHIL